MDRIKKMGMGILCFAVVLWFPIQVHATQMDSDKLNSINGEINAYQYGDWEETSVEEENEKYVIEDFSDGLLSPATVNAGVSNYIVTQLEKRVSPIDLTGDKIKKDDIASVLTDVLNSNPQLFFVNKSFGADYNPSTKNITKLYMTYDSTLYSMRGEYEKEVQAAMSLVDSSMSDYEKALIIHDYLALECRYYGDGTIEDIKKYPATTFTSYGVLVKKVAVCQGYALAYMDILNRLGIEAKVVASYKMNHAWNIIKVDGNMYHVDITWDDPVPDRIGYVCHDFFLSSDSKFRRGVNDNCHTDWVSEYSATSTFYDEKSSANFAFGVESGTFYSNSNFYYVKTDGYASRIIKRDQKTGNETVIKTMADVWYKLPYKGEHYVDGSKIFLYNNKLYYNTPSKVMQLDINTGEDSQVIAPNAAKLTADIKPTAFIFGIGLNGNNLVYSLKTNPYVSETRLYSTGLNAERVKYNLGEVTIRTTQGLKKNDIVLVKNDTYKILSIGNSKTVEYIKTTSKGKKITVPATVMINGVSFKVTSIGNNAFKGKKTMTNLTIGKNVTKIGSNSFLNCTKLKEIKIESTKITKVGSKALKNINKNAKIKVPKSKLSKYKKLFKSKGQKGSVTIAKM